MSKHDKTLAKMQRKPVPSDISWDAMAAALKYLGFKQLNNDGSRRKFFHKELRCADHLSRAASAA